MTMHPFITTTAAIFALHCSSVIYADQVWTNDFAAAKKKAAETHQSLLVNFTGSDWCQFCMALDKEVFAKDSFKTMAAEKLIAVTIDFPTDQSKISAATAKQNQALQIEYEVEGYPALILMDETGKPFAVTGYRKGGAEPYVKHLNTLLEGREKRDKAFKIAVTASGVDKAKALAEGLNALTIPDALRTKFYSKELEEIKKSDPNDETGFNKIQQAKERFAKFEEKLGEFAENDDLEGAMKLANKELKDGGYAVAETQELMMIRAMIFAQQKKFDEAIKAIGEAQKIAPESQLAKDSDEIIKQLEEAKKDNTKSEE